MKFIANENFPKPSILFLRSLQVDIVSIAESFKGISDTEVMEMAIKETRTILTHDSDYGELIFKYGFNPTAGVIYFRIYDFEPTDPGKILNHLISRNVDFKNLLNCDK